MWILSWPCYTLNGLQRCQSSRFRRKVPVFTSEIRHPVWHLNPPIFHSARLIFLNYLTHISHVHCKTSLENCNVNMSTWRTVVSWLFPVIKIKIKSGYRSINRNSVSYLTLLENQLKAMSTPSGQYAWLISQLHTVGELTSHSMPDCRYNKTCHQCYSSQSWKKHHIFLAAKTSIWSGQKRYLQPVLLNTTCQFHMLIILDSCCIKCAQTPKLLYKVLLGVTFVSVTVLLHVGRGPFCTDYVLFGLPKFLPFWRPCLPYFIYPGWHLWVCCLW